MGWLRKTVLAAAVLLLFWPPGTFGEGALDIGSRLELFVDDTLIDTLRAARRVLHQPVPREVVIQHDLPWEGSGSDYHTVFQDGPLYRMYYTAFLLTGTDGKIVTSGRPRGAYAESRDGIHWVKPELGVIEFKGSKRNNIVWDAEGLSPFKDPNPKCPPDARYKAIAQTPGGKGVDALKSSDGIRWSKMVDKPVITKGAFDSQNLAFWDEVRKEYRAYVRDFRNGVRDIRTCTSQDFINWTEPQWVEYPGAPIEHLYTNQVIPYYRAPHILLGFPARYVERPWSPSMEALPDVGHRRHRSSVQERYGTAVSDGVFMSSRDGNKFNRWGEAFLRPGPERRDNWVYGDGYQNWGLVETRVDDPGAPNEISVYSLENSWKATCRLRRFTLRVDGFVSVQGPLMGGELVTKPLRFDGRRLVLNFATSAAGSIQVEIQDGNGRVIEGFALGDCLEMFGDSLERAVRWKQGDDLRRLAGKPVRLRFVLKDADLYSIRFRGEPGA